MTERTEEEWGIALDARLPYSSSTHIVISDEMIMNSALGPWGTLAMYAEELITRWYRPDDVRKLQWDIYQVCRPASAFMFQKVDSGRSFICGRFDPASPLLRALSADHV